MAKKIKVSSKSLEHKKKRQNFSPLPLIFLFIIFGAVFFVACESRSSAPLVEVAEKDSKADTSEEKSAGITIELQADIHQFVDTYCISCHGETKQKGDRQFNDLAKFISNEDDVMAYREILEQLNLGEMPPQKKSVKQPLKSETKKVIAQLTEALIAWDDSHKKDFTVLKRLSKNEYRNTMRDLFGLSDIIGDPAKLIPEDTIDEGFKNIAESQSLSDAHLQEYLKAAEKYLSMAVHFGKTPATKTLTVKPTEWKAAPTREARTPWMYRLATPGKYLDIGCGKKNLADNVSMATYPRKMRNSGVPEAGYYTFKITAEAIRRLTHPYDPSYIPADLTQPMQLGLYIAYNSEGLLGGGVSNRQRIALWDLKDHKKDFYEITVWLDRGYIPFLNWDNGPGPTDWWMRDICRDYHDDIEFRGKEGAHAWHIVGKNAVPGRAVSDVWRGPLLRIHNFQLTGPLQKSFVNSPANTSLAENGASAVQAFAEKAFRRPLKPVELKPYLDLYDQAQKQLNKSKEEALLYTYKAILCSPDFLYLKEIGDEKGQLKNHELASRLSYFLWSSLPDAQLQESLKNKAPLGPLAERMLADKRSSAFVDGLLDSWLRFDKLGLMRPDSTKHREYYAFDLEYAMRQETSLFLKYILENNRPISEFLDADYTFLNHDLAMHYGIKGVDGSHFRKVNIQSNKQRGGLLGQASILTLSANGVDTSPIKRGIWVLENILGTPPPPPPPDVEPLEPDTRGATTLRQRLEKHRNVEACADCHNKIDPYGFPLENYGPTGRHRDTYAIRAWSARKNYKHKARKHMFTDDDLRFAPGFRLGLRKGPEVDAQAELPGVSTIDDLTGLNTALLHRHEQFSKALTEKLMIYALGRKMTYRDHEEIERIAHLKPIQNYGFRDLIIEIVNSKTFTELNK